MRLAVINANISPHITEIVAAEARATLGPSATVIPVTPRFGPAVIHTRLDVAVATHGVVEAAARIAAEADAVLLAVSYDTGAAALREALSIPVVGMSEATIAMARLAGGPVGYVVSGARSIPLYRETLAACDPDRDCVGWRAIEAPAIYAPGGGGAAADDAVLDAARLLAQDGAATVVILGAVLAGAARRLEGRAPVRVLDGGRCGALMAKALAALGPGPRRGGPEGRLVGVDPALAALAARA
jgi:allantoin racemase